MVNNKKYLIGNWKSNKNIREVTDWFNKFGNLAKKLDIERFNNLEIVLCVPFIYLSLVKNLKKDFELPIKIGAQNVSPFLNGAYTGEISAQMLSEFVDYVIIGHSERRKNFHENDKMLEQKFFQSQKAGLNSIYCIQDEFTPTPQGVPIIAYEPVWAIGSNTPDTPENASRIISTVKERVAGSIMLYGGSVNPDNIVKFLSVGNIDGVLPGGASLDPEKFWEMIVNASTI